MGMPEACDPPTAKSSQVQAKDLRQRKPAPLKVSHSFNLFRCEWVKLPNSEAVAPRQFSATIEEPGVTYRLQIELDASGHSVCKSFHAESERVPSTSMPRLLRLATAAAAGTGRYRGQTGERCWQIDGATAAEAHAAGAAQYKRIPTLRSDSRPDRHLEEFVTEYEAGLDRGEKKSEALEGASSACDFSRAKGYRWLADARQRGLLRAGL
jgi:hypothetical protein